MAPQGVEIRRAKCSREREELEKIAREGREEGNGCGFVNGGVGGVIVVAVGAAWLNEGCWLVLLLEGGW